MMKSQVKENIRPRITHLLSNNEYANGYSKFKLIERGGEFGLKIGLFGFLCSSELRGLANKLVEINKAQKTKKRA